MASPEVIWQQHNPVGAVYCHMLVFHSEHSLLSRMCFCFPGEHIFRPLTGTDTTVFSITPQTFICSCIIRKVYVKVMHLPSLKMVCSLFLFAVKIRHSPLQQFSDSCRDPTWPPAQPRFIIDSLIAGDRSHLPTHRAPFYLARNSISS